MATAVMLLTLVSLAAFAVMIFGLRRPKLLAEALSREVSRKQTVGYFGGAAAVFMIIAIGLTSLVPAPQLSLQLAGASQNSSGNWQLTTARESYQISGSAQHAVGGVEITVLGQNGRITRTATAAVDSGGFTYRVKLSEGRNNFKITAANLGGSVDRRLSIIRQPTERASAELSGSEKSSEPSGYVRGQTDVADLGAPHRVVSVVDGDTIKVDQDGATVTVRLIGLDTPETVHPSRPVECFGRAAAGKMTSLVGGQTVYLQTDPTQGGRDKYHRLLRYVRLADGTFVNKQMIAQGFGFEYTYNLPYQYQAQFQAAQRQARQQDRGLWAADTCGGSRQAPDQNTTDSDSTQTEDCNIKGNISYSGEQKIYHVPGQKYYSQTVIDESRGERWFCSEQAARNAGWRRSRL